MKRTIGLLLLIAGFLLASPQTKAQNIPSNINVDNLSDTQVQKIIDEVQARGLSMDEATQMARAKGVSENQIMKLKQRMLTLQQQTVAAQETNTAAVEEGAAAAPVIQKKSVFTPTKKLKQIFGYRLFNDQDLTFEPSVNIPVPQNYVIGINDEITINIWGASQQSYLLSVDANGNLQIPDLGPVHVGGIDLSDAGKLIRKRLTAIYNGMAGDHPNTYASVTLSALRSIKVNVIGEVNAPGTYTLPATASAFNALYLSGGPNEKGSFRDIRVIRDNKVIKHIDVYDYLLNGHSADNITLRDDDILLIPTYKKQVAVSGEFKRTGYFDLKSNETLTDLLHYTGGFKEKAYQQMLSVIRTDGKEYQMRDVAAGQFGHFQLQNGDSIVAGKIIDRFANRVTIQGAVFRPGSYALTDSMRLSGLIKVAQGVREDVFSNRGLLIRKSKNLSPTTIAFNVHEVLNGKNDLLLHREDQVVIQDIFSMRQNRFVRIYGQVQNPGEYAYSDSLTLKDLIFRAGGFTEAASESFIEVSRRHSYQAAAKLNDNLVRLYQFHIGRNLKIAPRDQQFELHPYDYVYVRRAPSYNEQQTVTINGEVLYPGPYSISSKNERVSDLIKRCGGLTPYAYVKGARLVRDNQDAGLIKQRLDAALPDSLVKKAAQQLRTINLELKLDAILKHPGSIYDYILKEGDRITIPEAMQEVRVNGEIMNPIGLAYQKGEDLKYYISKAGGFSTDAKKGKVFIIYADGTTQTTRSYGVGHKFPRPAPGCQIIVPKKPQRNAEAGMRNWLAISSTFASLAIAVAAVFR